MANGSTQIDPTLHSHHFRYAGSHESGFSTPKTNPLTRGAGPHTIRPLATPSLSSLTHSLSLLPLSLCAPLSLRLSRIFSSCCFDCLPLFKHYSISLSFFYRSNRRIIGCYFVLFLLMLSFLWFSCFLLEKT